MKKQNEPQLSAEMEKQLNKLMIGYACDCAPEVKHFLATALYQQKAEIMKSRVEERDSILRIITVNGVPSYSMQQGCNGKGLLHLLDIWRNAVKEVYKKSV